MNVRIKVTLFIHQNLKVGAKKNRCNKRIVIFHLEKCFGHFIQHVKCKNHDQYKSWVNALDSSLVKIFVSKCLLIYFLYNNAWYEESWDHKEDINPNEASRYCLRKCMKNDHQGDGNCPKAINIGPVLKFIMSDVKMLFLLKNLYLNVKFWWQILLVLDIG